MNNDKRQSGRRMCPTGRLRPSDPNAGTNPAQTQLLPVERVDTTTQRSFQTLLTDHREDERVGEVLIQGELDHISA